MSLNINLELNDVNVVLAGLAELPAKNSYDVINKVKNQAEAQLAASAVSEGSPSGQQLLVEGDKQ